LCCPEPANCLTTMGTWDMESHEQRQQQNGREINQTASLVHSLPVLFLMELYVCTLHKVFKWQLLSLGTEPLLIGTVCLFCFLPTELVLYVNCVTLVFVALPLAGYSMTRNCVLSSPPGHDKVKIVKNQCVWKSIKGGEGTKTHTHS
jgi:hypothetical protein